MSMDVRNLVYDRGGRQSSPAHDLHPKRVRAADLAFLPLVERLRQLRESRGHQVTIVFFSVAGGDGVSYVVNNLAVELEKHTGESVTVTTSSALALAEEQGSGYADGSPSDLLSSLRRKFPYVLIDCASLQSSSDAILLGRMAECCVLVVGAGRTTRDQVRGAVATLLQNSVPILGYVLNKRTYSIPRAIYKWL